MLLSLCTSLPYEREIAAERGCFAARGDKGEQGRGVRRCTERCVCIYGCQNIVYLFLMRLEVVAMIWLGGYGHVVLRAVPGASVLYRTTRQ